MKKKSILQKLITREPLTFSDKASSWLAVCFFIFWIFLLFLSDIIISFIIALILVVALIILVECKNRFLSSFVTVEKIKHMIQDANPTEMENIVANMYKRLGYRNVEVTQPSDDYGADVVMKRKKIKYVVQVKKYEKNNKIVREDIQKLQGAKEHYRANGMKFVTTGFYTQPALDYAHRHRIETIDGDELINLMYRSCKKDNKIL